jgi:hypothetical protein
MNEEDAYAQTSLSLGSISPANNSLLPRCSCFPFAFSNFNLYPNPSSYLNLHADPSAHAFPDSYSSPYTDPFPHS